jgi:uncharacterized protein YgiM (DUF1202 family)
VKEMLRLLFVINILFFSTKLFADPNQINKENSPTEIIQPFKSFTGKITGNKVRIRTSPDLDSHVIYQLNKNELVLVTNDAKDFWGIKPSSNVKAYVFRNYIIDNVVEADKVNIRLQPTMDSPIIGQLKNKEKIQGNIYSQNNKWLELSLPDNINFYISKEYITNVGDADYYAKMQNRKTDVEKLVNSAYFITQSECKKPYDEMLPQEAIDQFDLIIKEYSDFPQHVQQAKEGLALLQDNYLQKKIAYLEAKANISDLEKDELSKAVEKAKQYEPEVTNKCCSIILSDKMKFWEPIENSLYSTWTTFHPEKKIKDFYKEQEINATTIAGVVEGYSQNIKNKPGDYLVKLEDSSKAYLYSTKIDLNDYVGKKVKLQVSPRPNNNFAYPAYFVNSIEIQ